MARDSPLTENEEIQPSRKRGVNLIINILALAIPVPIKVWIFTEMTVTEWMLISGILYLIWNSFRKGKDLITVLILAMLNKLISKLENYLA